MRFLIVIILSVTILSFSCRNSEHVTAENARKGEALFNSVGCKQCHSVTGDTVLYGPSLNSIFKKEVVVLRGEKKLTLTIDREYILRSITDPEKEKPDGFGNKKMLPVNLTPDEIGFLADYLIYISGGQQLKNP